jgi:hypothetical protein
MERQNPETSIIADRMMTKELREADKRKILEAMEQIGHDVIYTDIATFLFWSDKSKVSRRMKEILDEPNSILCLTGEKRNTPENRPARVYRLLKSGEVAPTIPTPEHYMEGQTTAADYASKLIAGSKEGRLMQKDIFDTN